MGQDLIINGKVFKGVQNFGHLGSLINSKHVINHEINSKISASNILFYSLRKIFRSRDMSKAIKIKIYKMAVKSFVVSVSKTWAVAEMGMKRLGAGERKILRTCVPAVEQEMWRKRTDQQ